VVGLDGGPDSPKSPVVEMKLSEAPPQALDVGDLQVRGTCACVPKWPFNREAFVDHVEAAGEGDLEGALHVWVKCTVGEHVLLVFGRMDEYFLGGTLRAGWR